MPDVACRMCCSKLLRTHDWDTWFVPSELTSQQISCVVANTLSALWALEHAREQLACAVWTLECVVNTRACSWTTACDEHNSSALHFKYLTPSMWYHLQMPCGVYATCHLYANIGSTLLTFQPHQYSNSTCSSIFINVIRNYSYI